MEQKLTFEDALFALGLSRDLINEKTKEMQKLRKRVDAMQRKLDRYKKYARIKHQKENKRIQQECKKIIEIGETWDLEERNEK